MKRFVWRTYVSVQAETLKEASAVIEAAFPNPEDWQAMSYGVEVYAPGGEPDDVIEEDDGPVCICPPELLARDGFKGGCPVHSYSRPSGGSGEQTKAQS